MATKFWVEEDLQFFLDKLMEESGAGRIHFSCKNDKVFDIITADLVKRTGKPYTMEMVDIEYHRLHGRYWVWEQALKSKFVKWDPVENKLLVRDEALWNILLKVVEYSHLIIIF
ncbi:hypothetical protein ACJIZ3_008885 [Penstemon smallii]|uniref:Myb/SANT-like domain-containing protein n=1 Tax=Penstemon smallii TaxID=265156 RepID=A0ABD3TB39_9LAMI